MGRRIRVIFSDQAFETLDEMAKRKNKTISEVIRDAVGLERWMDETREQGGHILVERSGTVREVMPLR